MIDDTRIRCWPVRDDVTRTYHDQEWGRPVRGEARLLEKICLEGFQSGLSWDTILRKRPGFRAAFAGFDPEAVAGFGDSDVARLLADARIVRNRRKIESAIANARATADLHAAGETLAGLVWAHRPPDGPAPRSWADVAASTPESTALARELKRRGFRFVGPTTVYAMMQAVGVVNDHLAACFVRDEVEALRAVECARDDEHAAACKIRRRASLGRRLVHSYVPFWRIRIGPGDGVLGVHSVRWRETSEGHPGNDRR